MVCPVLTSLKYARNKNTYLARRCQIKAGRILMVCVTIKGLSVYLKVLLLAF